jgi:hypothetical protein
MIPSTISDEDLIGKCVEVSAPQNILYGKQGVVSYVLSSGDRTVQVKLHGEYSTTFWERDDLSLVDGSKSKNGCECGSSTVGSPRHSTWCKLYKDWEDE